MTLPCQQLDILLIKQQDTTPNSWRILVPTKSNSTQKLHRCFAVFGTRLRCVLLRFVLLTHNTTSGFCTSGSLAPNGWLQSAGSCQYTRVSFVHGWIYHILLTLPVSGKTFLILLTIHHYNNGRAKIVTSRMIPYVKES